MCYVAPKYLNIPNPTAEGWRESRNTNRDGHTIFTRVCPDGTDRYEIVCRNNQSGVVVAQASWGTHGDAYRHGEKLFGDRMEAAGLPRQGY